jgi:enamine deaminase RidA (YjgF/YER057c/UK114 family)
VATVDDLILVAGVVATDAAGAVPEPGDLDAQAARALSNLEASLSEVGAGLDEVVKLKAYYATDGGVDEAALLARLRGRFDADLAPVLTAIPVRHLAYPGMALQLHCIGQRGWRRADNLEAVQGRFPIGRPERLGSLPYTDAIRAEEMMYFAAQAALDEAGRVISPGDGVAQTRVLMDRLGELLAALGASFQDAIKKEGYYLGRDMAEWAAMARVRAAYFRDPAAVATVVPASLFHQEGLLSKVEILAMRSKRGKYIPRQDSWPASNWDWPIPVPYRQGIRLGRKILIGGQVAFEPGRMNQDVLHAGDRGRQVDVVMGYIEAILAGLSAGLGDLRLLVCHFEGTGTAADTQAFLQALAGRVTGPLRPLTLVSQPRMHTEEMAVEIWAMAEAPA